MVYTELLSQLIPLVMSDHYQYVDTYYTSSYPDGESVNSGTTRLNYGYPSQACYGFPGQATASGSSASVFVGPNQLPANVVRFCACTCIFVLHVCSPVVLSWSSF